MHRDENGNLVALDSNGWVQGYDAGCVFVLCMRACYTCLLPFRPVPSDLAVWGKGGEWGVGGVGEGGREIR